MNQMEATRDKSNDKNNEQMDDKRPEIERKEPFENHEQFATAVLDYTSRYNTLMIYSYAPENLTGKPYKYPMYGDFPDTYMLRTYGNWWKSSPASQKHYMPQDQEEIVAEDFVVLRFYEPVIPRAVIIYETYNPGAVVRIWGRLTGTKWRVFWEEPPTVRPKTSRKFHVEIKDYTGLIDQIRLDLNQSLLSYYAGLDAVLLSGKKPKTALQVNLLRCGFLKLPSLKVDVKEEPYVYDENQPSYFSTLPGEIIIKIFTYLDLKSLSRCAQVNTIWAELVKVPTIYKNLSLKKYWHKVNNNVLESFIPKCRVLKKLDLSWCGESDTITSGCFTWFLINCGMNLTHLSLCHCPFIGDSLGLICLINTLEELRLRDAQLSTWIPFTIHSTLKNLTTLDLAATSVTPDPLIHLLKRNLKLKHLNIDLCENLRDIDRIARITAEFNLELVSWSSWKSHTMSTDGLECLSKLVHLEEINVGWCPLPINPIVSPTVLEAIGTNCPKLNRLILSGWRNINNSSLMPVVFYCKELQQLDLLGMKYVSADVCDKLLSHLKKLRLLDVSFCEMITPEDIVRWRELYPNVAIQRSCEHALPNQMWEFL